MQVRSFTTDDYAEIAAIATAAIPEQPSTSAGLAYADQHRASHLHFGRWVAVEKDLLLGYAHYMQYADIYDPYRLWVMVAVHPDHRRKGVGSALHMHLLEHIAHLSSIEALQVRVRENHTDGLAFAERQGYGETGRRWPARLDVAGFDATAFAGRIRAVSAQGIRIVALSDMRRDPQHIEKLYRLQTVLDADIPIDEPVTPFTLEQFRAEVFDNPGFLKEGTFVALFEDQYIGMSSLFDRGGGLADIELTGTLAAYRRRGIALALKLRGIEWAQRHGYTAVLTVNDVVNTGILAINERLGFVRQPALIKYVRPLT